MKLAIAACVVALAGCASTELPLVNYEHAPVVPVGPQEVGKLGSILIARDEGLLSSSLIVEVTVGTTVVGTLKAGDGLRVSVSPGRHLVRVALLRLVQHDLFSPALTVGPATHTKPQTLDIDVAAEKTSVMRIGFDDESRLFAWKESSR